MEERRSRKGKRLFFDDEPYRFCFLVDKDDFAKFKALAEKHRLSPSAYMRALVASVVSGEYEFVVFWKAKKGKGKDGKRQRLN